MLICLFELDLSQPAGQLLLLMYTSIAEYTNLTDIKPKLMSIVSCELLYANGAQGQAG